MENKEEMNVGNQDNQIADTNAPPVNVEKVCPDEEGQQAEKESGTEQSETESSVSVEAKEEQSIPEEQKPARSVFEPYEPQQFSDEQSMGEQPAQIPPKQKKGRLIGEIIGGVAIVVLLFYSLGVNSKNSDLTAEQDKLRKEYNELSDQNISIDNEVKTKEKEIEKLKAEIEELKNGAAKQLVDVRNAYDSGDWKKTIELASALHEKYNGSEEDKKAQEMATASRAKIDEAEAAKAAEEAKGYETGITYDQLARTPDEFKNKKVKFYGKVIQVIEGSGNIQIRLAVDDDYDRILLGEFSKSIVSRRVLEDDYITIYGKSVGTISYQSTMKGTITIPGIYIDKIEQ